MWENPLNVRNKNHEHKLVNQAPLRSNMDTRETNQ